MKKELFLKAVEELEQEIADYIRRALETAPIDEMDEFAGALLSYNEIKKNLCMQLVGTEANTDMLRDVPHFDTEDISMIIRFWLPDSPNCFVTVTNSLLESWDVSKEELLADALDSAQKNDPEQIMSLAEKMISMMGDVPEALLPVLFPMDIQEDPMKIITTAGIHDGHYGAAAIFYEGVLEKIAKVCDGKAYLLPSSVHEWIAVPREDLGPEADALKDMVTEINMTEVRPEDKLTDAVYFTDGKCFKKIL